jgi:hypothetical protein
MPWAVAFLRSAIALLLLAAGVSKLLNRQALTRLVLNYQLLPPPLARGVARILPELEVALAILLVSRPDALLPGVAAAALFGLFATAIAVNLVRGRSHIACGCFGASDDSPLSGALFLRAVALAGGALLTVAPWPEPRLPPTSAEGLSALLAAAVTLACGWLGSASAALLKRTAVGEEALRHRVPSPSSGER